ncbi:MAG: class I SAM-dependent methyltransferase [Candidatus Azambacteria bacterium]|nr:class I SAM-dependent methyltransferase [Candidatus Azambacteria bacterium]
MDGQAFLNVEKIIEQLNVGPNMAVADFGAGHGFFSVAFAKRVGSSGQIFAVDILQAALEAIRSRARLEGLFNIKLVKGDLGKIGGSTLPEESCDMVFIANLLFQVPDKSELIGEAFRILKKGGELAIVEWKPYISLGPQKEQRLSEEEVKQIVAPKGFGEPKQIDAGSHHYGLIFIKN